MSWSGRRSGPSTYGALFDEAEVGGMEDAVAEVEAQGLARSRVRFWGLPDPRVRAAAVLQQAAVRGLLAGQVGRGAQVTRCGDRGDGQRGQVVHRNAVHVADRELERHCP